MPLNLLTYPVVGLACKAFLNLGFCSISVDGLPILLEALRRAQQGDRPGVLTVSNHISVLDDPLIWGALPTKNLCLPRTRRWALGASDIMFTNPAFSAFFRHGQVLETFRGQGIYQRSVDDAIAKLNDGGWLHLFPESKVVQPSTYNTSNGAAHLPRFKWGIGRILMEVKAIPIILPMWLTGFDKLMPEGRPFPNKHIPRLGVNLSVTFGEPIPAESIEPSMVVLDPISSGDRSSLSGVTLSNDTTDSEMKGADCKMDQVRSEITAIIQHAVEELGRNVSGSQLGKS